MKGKRKGRKDGGDTQLFFFFFFFFFAHEFFAFTVPCDKQQKSPRSALKRETV
jgi:hypothetical protein